MCQTSVFPNEFSFFKAYSSLGWTWTLKSPFESIIFINTGKNGNSLIFVPISAFESTSFNNFPWFLLESMMLGPSSWKESTQDSAILSLLISL